MTVQLTEKQKKNGWQIVKFAEIAKNVSKRVDPTTTDLKVYVGLEHLDPQSLRIQRKGVPGDVKGQKLRVRPGQIIFGKRRAYQKKLAIADFDGICSAHAMVLEEILGKIIPGLLPFFMQSDMFMDRAVAISEGSLSPTIKWKSLAVQEFPLPPLKRQKEILEVLESLEFTKIKAGQLFCASATLAISMDCYLFGGLEKYIGKYNHIKSLPKGWDFLPLKQCSTLITKGASPKWQGFDYVETGTLFVTSENVRDKKLDISAPKFIPNEFSENNLKRSILITDDLLVNLVGASIGRCAIWRGEYQKANINQAVALIRLKPKIIDPNWLLSHFYTRRGQEYFGLSKVDNARPNISLTAIGNFMIPVPPIKEQQEILQYVDNEAFSSVQKHLVRINLLNRIVANSVFRRKEEYSDL